MKVVRLRAPGGIDRLEIGEAPDPGRPGPGEIRVRLHASSLNFHDYSVVMGFMPVTDWRIPMSDGAGVVEAVGLGVHKFEPGDHVVSCFFPTWRDGPPPVADFDTVPGDGVDGYARECVVCPETFFTRSPEHYNHEEAATITTAGVTAWRALIVDGNLKAGESVLVMGTGGVSLYALQLAKALGARVIATSSSEEKLDRLRKLGVDETINYKSNPDWGEKARALTDGRGVDHVIEIGGAGTLHQSIAATALGGHIALIGVLAGFKVELATAAFMMKQIKLQGIAVGSRKHQIDLVHMLQTKKLRPVVDSTYRIEDIANAFVRLQSGDHFGKICLKY